MLTTKEVDCLTLMYNSLNQMFPGQHLRQNFSNNTLLPNHCRPKNFLCKVRLDNHLPQPWPKPMH